LGTQALASEGRGQEALAEAEAALYVCRQHGMPEMSDFAALIAAQTGRPRTVALLLGHAPARWCRSAMC
jgi:hypothetical protein